MVINKLVVMRCNEHAGEGLKMLHWACASIQASVFPIDNSTHHTIFIPEVMIIPVTEHEIIILL